MDGAEEGEAGGAGLEGKGTAEDGGGFVRGRVAGCVGRTADFLEGAKLSTRSLDK